MDTDSLYMPQQHQHQQQQHYQANLLPPQPHFRRDSSSSSSGGLSAFLRQHSVGSLGNSHYNPAGNSSSSAAGAAKRQRNSFSQMLTSLESELQSGDALGLGSSSSSSAGLSAQQYGRSGIGGAANPNSSHLQLFNRPGFCSTLREFAHELQHSSRGLSGNLGSSSEQSGAHGLNLLHTTAVRRRSSLSELYNAARRRSSLSDLIQSLGGPIGQPQPQQNGHSSAAAAAAGADAASSDMNGYSSGVANMSLSASGRKRSRAELDFDNPSSSRNMSFGLGISSGSGSSNNWGLDTVGAMLRPSIISALTSLNEEHAQQSSGSGSAGADGSSSGDSSGVQRQCSITDWMDGEALTNHYAHHKTLQSLLSLLVSIVLCTLASSSAFLQYGLPLS
jgi:hypothetical protein